MKKEGNHKRAQKSAKRSKSFGVVQKRWDTRRGKEKRARKKKVSKIRVVVVVVVGAPKSLKNFQKKKKQKFSLWGSLL